MKIQKERYFERICFITLVLFCGFMFWQFRPCGSELYEKRYYTTQSQTSGLAVRRMKTFLINMTADLLRDANRKVQSVWFFRKPYQKDYNCTLEFNAGDLVFNLRHRYARMWKLFTRSNSMGDQLPAAEIVGYFERVNAFGREISELVDLFKTYPHVLEKPTTTTKVTKYELKRLLLRREWKGGRSTPSLRELGQKFVEAPTRPNNMYKAKRKRRPRDDGGFEAD